MSVFDDNGERMLWIQRVMDAGFTLRQALQREYKRTTDTDDKAFYAEAYALLFDRDIRELIS